MVFFQCVDGNHKDRQKRNVNHIENYVADDVEVYVEELEKVDLCVAITIRFQIYSTAMGQHETMDFVQLVARASRGEQKLAKLE